MNEIEIDTFSPDDENDGAHLILAERTRHMKEEGFGADHDDQWQDGELALAAACYAVEGTDKVVTDMIEGTDAWPWSKEWDKRKKHSNIRRLVIAGSLIAAEIDRLRRAREAE